MTPDNTSSPLDIRQERPDDFVGDLRLRRHLAGEGSWQERQRLDQRLQKDAALREAYGRLIEEQKAFAQALVFKDFEKGVRDAQHRSLKSVPRATRWSRAGLGAGVALAAAAGFLLFVPLNGTVVSSNRIKGEAQDINVRIDPANGDAQFDAPKERQKLNVGDRMRIGYTCHPNQNVVCQPQHMAVLSVDQSGEVTPLYPEAGAALLIEAGPQREYFPDSLELFGQGLERLVILSAPRAFSVDAARRAVREHHAKSPKALGNADHWRALQGWSSNLDLNVQSFLFEKP